MRNLQQRRRIEDLTFRVSKLSRDIRKVGNPYHDKKTGEFASGPQTKIKAKLDVGQTVTVSNLPAVVNKPRYTTGVERFLDTAAATPKTSPSTIETTNTDRRSFMRGVGAVASNLSRIGQILSRASPNLTEQSKVAETMKTMVDSFDKKPSVLPKNFSLPDTFDSGNYSGLGGHEFTGKPIKWDLVDKFLNQLTPSQRNDLALSGIEADQSIFDKYGKVAHYAQDALGALFNRIWEHAEADDEVGGKHDKPSKQVPYKANFVTPEEAAPHIRSGAYTPETIETLDEARKKGKDIAWVYDEKESLAAGSRRNSPFSFFPKK